MNGCAMIVSLFHTCDRTIFRRKVSGIVDQRNLAQCADRLDLLVILQNVVSS